MCHGDRADIVLFANTRGNRMIWILERCTEMWFVEVGFSTDFLVDVKQGHVQVSF